MPSLPLLCCPRLQKTLITNVQMCRIILIVQGWPTKPWFWDLVEMSLDVPRLLPTQMLLKHYHSHPASLNLHVWYPEKTKLQQWQVHCRGGRKICCSIEYLKKSHLLIKMYRFSKMVYGKTGGFQESLKRGHLHFFWHFFHCFSTCSSTIEGYKLHSWKFQVKHDLQYRHCWTNR